MTKLFTYKQLGFGSNLFLMIYMGSWRHLWSANKEISRKFVKQELKGVWKLTELSTHFLNVPAACVSEFHNSPVQSHLWSHRMYYCIASCNETKSTEERNKFLFSGRLRPNKATTKGSPKVKVASRFFFLCRSRNRFSRIDRKKCLQSRTRLFSQFL